MTNGDYTIRDRWMLADDQKSIRIDREFSGEQGATARHIILEKQ